MNDGCIGLENKSEIKNTSDRVRELESKVKELENKVSSLHKDKADSETIHKMDIRLLELTHKLEEMKNNRKEDRQAIFSMNESISDLSSKLEEYIENSFKISSEQSLYHERQGNMEKLIIKLSEDIEKNNIFNQINTFSQKSKLHKFGVGMFYFTLVMMFISAAAFIFGGGLTLPGIIEIVKGVIA